jgi:hypothetical protein
MWRVVSKAGIPSIKEPHGLIRSEGKRIDGQALLPWLDGRCATLAVTVSDTVAAPFMSAFHHLAQPQLLNLLLNAKKINTLKFPALTILSSRFWYLWSFGPINQVGMEVGMDLFLPRAKDLL